MERRGSKGRYYRWSEGGVGGEGRGRRVRDGCRAEVKRRRLRDEVDEMKGWRCEGFMEVEKDEIWRWKM